MTTAIKAIKSDYQQNLDNLAEEKKQLLAQREELIQAQNILLKHGVDDLEVYLKIREIEQKINNVIKDEEYFNNEIARQINYAKRMNRKAKEQKAFEEGIRAYNEAVANGSYVAVCKFNAKYLKKQWEKGYKEMSSTSGSLLGIQYAA